MRHASFRFADVTLDLMTCRAYRHGKILSMHLAEFRILTYLCCHAPQPVSANELCHKILGQIERHESSSLPVHIHRLRSRLKDPGARPGKASRGSGDIIETWPGGYRLVPEVTFSCGDL